METKPFWESKIFWLNFIAAVFIGAGWVVDHQGILPLLGLSPSVAGVIVTVANIILRFRTVQPVSLVDHR